eukprot:TRINITY_DN1085_c0_g1_i2.p1 TRINITY_DN1085_c0_g1~~TRINITY_DN1085_c0_g1_i2.p1  ORF type:complete len:193 (-),score=14.17 TRINITY_DN1085_c0_g1_i2:188-766(-)
MDSDSEFECVSVLHGHTQDVKMVTWHPNREVLASCSYDDSIRMWKESEDDWFCSDILTGHTSTVWEISFDPTGRRLVSCGDDKTVIIWKEVEDEDGDFKWKNACTLSGEHRRTIYTIDWSKANVIATGSGDDSIRIFEERSKEGEEVSFICVLTKEKAHAADVNCVRWHPTNPRLLASAGDDNLVNIYEYID